MNTSFSIDPITRAHYMNIELLSHELSQSAAMVRYNAMLRAEKLLAKIIIRSFLRQRDVKELAASIDINKILADSLKVNLTFGEKE